MKDKQDGEAPPWDETDDELFDDWVYESRCKVCKLDPRLPGYHQFRQTLRTMFLTSSTRRTHRELERFFVRWPKEARFSVDSLQTHLSKHMTPRTVALREIRLQEATKDGQEISDELLENYFNPVANLRLIAAMGMEQLAAGRMPVKVRDLERVNALIIQLEPEVDHAAEVMRMRGEHEVVIECVLRVMTEEQRRYLVEMLEAHRAGDPAPRPPMSSPTPPRVAASSYRPLRAANHRQARRERGEDDDDGA